jgi:hypothetical protein
MNEESKLSNSLKAVHFYCEKGFKVFVLPSQPITNIENYTFRFIESPNSSQIVGEDRSARGKIDAHLSKQVNQLCSAFCITMFVW